MQVQKVFNPWLIIKALFAPFMLNRTVESPSWWESKDEARKYARILAEGLTFWSTVDIIMILTLGAVSHFVLIPLYVVGVSLYFGLGGPILMTLLMMYGCLRRLTAAETFNIIRDYYRE